MQTYREMGLTPNYFGFGNNLFMYASEITNNNRPSGVATMKI